MRYLDSSAIVKLVVREPETARLVEALREDPVVVSSQVAWTEVVIATRRAGRSTARAERILDGIALVPIDEAILRDAATLGPKDLRTLDAIHLGYRDLPSTRRRHHDHLRRPAIASSVRTRTRCPDPLAAGGCPLHFAYAVERPHVPDERLLP